MTRRSLLYLTSLLLPLPLVHCSTSNDSPSENTAGASANGNSGTSGAGGTSGSAGSGATAGSAGGAGVVDPARPPFTVAQNDRVKAVCDAYVAGLRGALDRCCSQGDMFSEKYSNLYNETGILDEACASVLQSFGATGRIAIDEAKATSCINGASAVGESTPCGAIFDIRRSNWGKDCSTSVVGLQSQGQLCTHRMDCAPGLACMGMRGPTGEELNGTCEPLPSDGEPCALEQMDPYMVHENLFWAFEVDNLFGDRPSCKEDSFCYVQCKYRRSVGGYCVDDSWCAEPLRCFDGKCTENPTFGEIGAPCSDNTGCKTGLFCPRQDYPVAHVCTAPLPDSEPCIGDTLEGLAEPLQCRGACVILEGEEVGKCASVCSSG